MPKPPTTFHAFTIKYDRVTRAIITSIKVSRAFDPQSSPEEKYIETQALWDTGATGSVITRDTVIRLGLIPTGKITVSHAGGMSDVSTYVVNFVLPNNVGTAGVLVSEADEIHGGKVGVIIGMDVITQGDFALTNVNGLSCVSYRIPSVEKVDYVAQANMLRYAGTPPNSRCPCGSGEKFKKCCGKMA